jgi:hypothetical protein
MPLQRVPLLRRRNEDDDLVEITVFRKHDAALTKRFELGCDGEIQNDSTRCSLSRGTAMRRKVSLKEFAAMISKTAENVSYALGAFDSELPRRVQIATKAMIAAGEAPEGAIARTAENIQYKPQRSFVLLDYDTKALPDDVKEEVADLGGFIDAIETVCPAIKRAGLIMRSSTSAGIVNVETGEPYESSGLHAYLAIEDGTDAERFGAALFDRCWLQGLGFFVVGKAGQRLDRSIIDGAVFHAERLCFEADAELSEGLRQEPRKAEVCEGGFLDTRAFPDLSDAEKAKLRLIKDKAAKAIEPECRAARESFVEERAQAAIARGASAEAARQMAESWSRGVLLPDVPLEFDKCGTVTVTVAEVLADPDRWVGETLADPVEGVAYGRCKAMVMQRRDGSLFVHSFAHGACHYELGDVPRNKKLSQDDRLNAQIADLAALPPLDYELRRKKARKDLDIRQKTLDEAVEAERTKIKIERGPPPPTLYELAVKAEELIACPNVLQRFSEDFGRLVVGEGKTSKLDLLIGTSRLFEKAMHAAYKGPSAVGKSEVREKVLRFFPPEDVISFTALSERALLYMPDDFAHKILSMGEAQSGDEVKFQDYLLRELMSENRLRYLVTQKNGDKIESVLIEKNGPVAFMVTTTRNRLNPENETRMLSLEFDDSANQTSRVMQRVASIEGFGDREHLIDFALWHDFQRWLAAGERRVMVPFALALARLMPNESVRMRRDIGQILRAIKAHALLHRRHRQLNDKGKIIATIDDDYETVRPLMDEPIASAAEAKLRKAITQTLDALASLQRHTEGHTARDVGSVLKIDASSAWRRLRQAEDAGLVENTEERPRRPGRYVLTNQEENDFEVLPSKEELAAEMLRRKEK